MGARSSEGGIGVGTCRRERVSAAAVCWSANDGSESAGPSAPGEGTPGFKLDPARRPKDWTAVAVPRRLVTSGQWVSGRLGPVEGEDRRRPGESPNNTGQWRLHLGGWAGPWSCRRRTTGQRVPGRLLQVRVPPGFKLDPARRPKDWTAVAVLEGW